MIEDLTKYNLENELVDREKYENSIYAIRIYSGDAFCDCNIKDASFELNNGSVNDIFKKFYSNTGKISTDYEFSKGEKLDIYIGLYTGSSENDGYELYELGTFYVTSLTENDYVYTYQLSTNETHMECCPPIATLNEKYGVIIRNISQLVHYSFLYYGYNSPIDVVSSDYELLLSNTDLFDVTQYTIDDLYYLYNVYYCNASIVGAAPTNDSLYAFDYEYLYENSSEAGDRIGHINFIAIKFKVYNAYVEIIKESTEDGNTQTTIPHSETRDNTIYFKLDWSNIQSSGNPNILRVTESDCTGNGITVEYPFIVDYYNTQYDKVNANINDFTNKMEQSIYNNIDSFKCDFTVKKIKSVFVPDFLCTDHSLNYSFAFADAGVHPFVRLNVAAYRENIRFDGGLIIEINTGDQWSGGTTSTSAGGTSGSYISSSSSVGDGNYENVIATIQSMQDKINNMSENFLSKNSFVKMLSSADFISATAAILKNLTEKSFETEELKAGVANIDWLKADDAIIGNLQVAGLLTADSAVIKDLQSDTANITDLIFGTAGGTSITTEFANSVVSVIGDAQIESAMIKGLAVEKLLSGTIYTNNINIQSEDGGMKIVGNTQQFKDASGKIRMQMGQDGNGDFSMSIFGTDGKTAVLTDEGLATADAIPDGLIKNVKIADDANISAGKLDIASLFTTMNADKTHTLHSSIIMFDETNQSLNVALSQMSSNIETLTNVAYGQVVTYNTTTVPTLSNYPAYDWVIPVYPSDTLYPSDELIFKYGYEEYVKHVGAVCYMKDSTDSYRFCMADDGTFYWKLIEDSETAVLNTKVAALEVSTSGISSQVSSMSQTISAQGSTLTTLASEISQNESDIALRVLETTYNNGMAGKSNKASILSEINLSTEGIKIKADRLNLDGLVTITNLGNGSTSINGACIKTGTISADRIDINSLFSKNITATNMNITGGSLAISANSGVGVIHLKDYISNELICYPNMLVLQNILSKQAITIQPNQLIMQGVGTAKISGSEISLYDSSANAIFSATTTESSYTNVSVSSLRCESNIYVNGLHPVIYDYGRTASTLSSKNSVSGFRFAQTTSSSYLEASTGYGAYGISWWASDTRLKKDIISTKETALDKIEKIKFIQFDWKETEKHEILGVSANQLEEIMPDVVFRVPQPEDSEYDFLRNIDTGKMTTYAMKAIQELNQVVKQQNERIEELESMIQKGTVD